MPIALGATPNPRPSLHTTTEWFISKFRFLAFDFLVAFPSVQCLYSDYLTDLALQTTVLALFCIGHTGLWWR